MSAVTENIRVWCTRPDSQNSSWIDRVEALGFETLDISLLSIDGIDAFADIERAKQQIINLDHYQRLIFVSQNAVDHAGKWIEKYWPQCPLGLAWYAVGQKTAKALQETVFDIFAIKVQVEAASSSMTSETLLSLDSLQDVRGEKICLFRGLGGRPTIHKVLEERGAIVDLCELYRRSVPDGAAQKLKNILHNRDANAFKLIQDYIVVFSGETLANLHSLLDENLSQDVGQYETAPKEKIRHGDPCVALKQSAKLFVPSARVAELAESFGFTNVLCAENATEEAMIAAIHQNVEAH